MQSERLAQDAINFGAASKQCCIAATLAGFSKHAAEQILVKGSDPARRRRGRLGHSIILAYHNVIPAGEAPAGERSLHLSQRDFAAQLDVLSDSHDVVPLSEIFSRGADAGGRPRAAITFDDAYRGALTAGVAELGARSLPATFFIPPAFVPDGTFWWDVYAQPGGELDARLRDYALTHCRGDDAFVRSWAAGSGWRAHLLPHHAAVANEAELTAAGSIRGMTFGSHTWSHHNLTRLPSEQVAYELRASLDWLKTRFANAIAWLSYPYGRFSSDTERIAGQAGYEGAVGISGGWVRPVHTAPLAVPRLNVPNGLSIDGFRLRISGLVGDA